MFVTIYDIQRIKCMLQLYMLMQMSFRFKIHIHKWYLGQTEVVGYFFMLGFSFTRDLIVSLVQTR